VSARHDGVFDALLALEGRLAAEDAQGADEATDRVLELLARATDPAADTRLRPAFVRCQALADALKAKLAAQLKESATSHRAARAYEREGAGAVP
jgi:hypothetical protein